MAILEAHLPGPDRKHLDHQCMEIEAFEKKLKYHFKDKSLLQLALTHPSKGYELRKKLRDNQRLEFLGDAVLQLALTIYLFDELPQQAEGNLTQLRARLVNRETLAELASELQLGQYLALGRGEEKNEGRTKTSNLADALEAVIGALFLDSDYKTATAWIHKNFASIIKKHSCNDLSFNPKGNLQELLQSQGKPTPIYETLDESGPDHDKTYTVAVKANGETLATGEGSSKKAAEAAAAQAALDLSHSGS
ncbi:MAG: ribonuclease III [Verrucomicrobiota bacterium]